MCFKWLTIAMGVGSK